MQIRLFFTISLICISLTLFAQHGTHTFNIHPETKQVTNFITKYYFTHVYSKKFDSDQSLRTDRARINLYFQILNDGTGKVVEDISDNQKEFLVSSCFKKEDHFKFEMTNNEGTAFIGTLYLKNKNVEKFTVESTNDIRVYFSPNTLQIK
ncbi:hypothetical protein [Rufibacter soli]